MGKAFSDPSESLRGAWVAKLGQRRQIQGLVSQEFPGSNPGPRIPLLVKLIPSRAYPLTDASEGREDGDDPKAHRLGVRPHGGAPEEVGEARGEDGAVPLPLDAERRRGARPRGGGPDVRGEGGPVEGERRAPGAEQAVRGREEDGPGARREARGRGPPVPRGPRPERARGA